MALSDDDLRALQLLIKEEVRAGLEAHLTPFREEVRTRFDEVDRNFDALFARDEKREQEYLLSNEQTSRLARRIEDLEEKVA